MERFGILEYFDFTIFSADLGIRKPNKDLYLKALEMGNVPAEKAIFIGDRIVEDVGGPQSVGIKAVLKYIEKRGYTEDIKPYKTINELSELDDIVF
jgi:putative hydrolase of the HAD superfamily